MDREKFDNYLNQISNNELSYNMATYWTCDALVSNFENAIGSWHWFLIITSQQVLFQKHASWEWQYTTIDTRNWDIVSLPDQRRRIFYEMIIRKKRNKLLPSQYENIELLNKFYSAFINNLFRIWLYKNKILCIDCTESSTTIPTKTIESDRKNWWGKTLDQIFKKQYW
jgi:hypothetical protein